MKKIRRIVFCKTLEEWLVGRPNGASALKRKCLAECCEKNEILKAAGRLPRRPSSVRSWPIEGSVLRVGGTHGLKWNRPESCELISPFGKSIWRTDQILILRVPICTANC